MRKLLWFYVIDICYLIYSNLGFLYISIYQFFLSTLGWHGSLIVGFKGVAHHACLSNASFKGVDHHASSLLNVLELILDLNYTESALLSATTPYLRLPI